MLGKTTATGPKCANPSCLSLLRQDGVGYKIPHRMVADAIFATEFCMHCGTLVFGLRGYRCSGMRVWVCVLGQ